MTDTVTRESATAATAGRPSTPAELDLLDTDIEESLRRSVHQLLADRCDVERVLAAYDGERGLTTDLWGALARDLGLAGLLVPEELDGAGASAREAAVVLEELGRATAPVPFLTSAVVATTALLHASRTQEGSEVLSRLARGEQTAALLVPLTAHHASYRAGLAPAGTVTSVAGVAEADVLLVPVSVEDRVELHAVGVADVAIAPVVSLDETRPLSDVDLTGATGTVVVADAAEAVRSALLVGAALLASEQVGVAHWCLEATVRYLKERRQFGRVVGGYQALKHRLADVYVEVESARAVARHAAAALAAQDEDVEIATCLASSYCADAAVRAAEECVQLHGGLGMTWEHPAHLYLKRAKADQLALGTPGAHRRRLAELIDLAPA